MEFDILCQIGFDCELDLPNEHISQFCKSATDARLEKYAYMFLNDSFMTTAYLYFHPKVLAAACLLMSHIFMAKMGMSDQSLSEGWEKMIDEELTLDLVGEAKDQIKKCY
jgi:hypothetical protein